MDGQNSVQQTTPVQAKTGMSTTVKVLLGCGGCAIIAIIIVVIVFGATIFGAAKVVESVGNDIQATEKANEENFKNPKAINSTIKVGDVEWKVSKAEDLGSKIKADDTYLKDCIATSGSKFIHIRFTIKNNGSKVVDTTNLSLFDNNKREFSTYSNTYSCLSNEKDIFISEEINPGLQKEYEAYYEVPTDSKSLRVKVGDLEIFGNKFDYISLGL